MKKIYDILGDGSKKVAILVDPDKMSSATDLNPLIEKIQTLNPSFIFVGGSSVDPVDFSNCVRNIKGKTALPIVIFPGSHLQISPLADAILFLSLISGRNPDFLIGHQIESAPVLRKMNLETIPTGYVLIDGGKPSSVAYISQTTPIPADQISIVVNTVIAGEMLGLKAIFLDAGSGAEKPISTEIIKAVRKNTNLPLIVGGGIKTKKQLENALGAGADLVVIGNKIEEDNHFLTDIKETLTNKKFICTN